VSDFETLLETNFSPNIMAYIELELSPIFVNLVKLTIFYIT